MTLATSAQFLEKRTRRYAEVTIPTLGEVRLQSLSDAERTVIDLELHDEKGKRRPNKMAEYKGRLIAACVVNEEGQCIFTEGDAKMLIEMDAAVVNAIVDAINQRCGLDTDLETLAKN